MVVAATVAAVALWVWLALLPGVGDAPARAAAIMRAHHTRAVQVPASARIARAVVAVEDQRFYSHRGIDSHSLLRVAIHTLSGSGDQGGATIDQQLAKLLYTGDRHDAAGKVEQLGLAFKLDHHYSKATLLNLYLNVTYWGDNHWGIAQASRGYFDKPPAALSWREASLLAGLLQAPSAYDPRGHLQAAQRRQRHVLDRLVATGTLSRTQADGAYRDLAHEAASHGFQTRPT
jgi:membrane peptidoglycan carboxypeptidase